MRLFFKLAGDSDLCCTRVSEQFEAVFDVLVVAAFRQVHGLGRGAANNEFIADDVHFQDGVSEGFEPSFCMGVVSHEQIVFDGGEDQLEAFGYLTQC